MTDSRAVADVLREIVREIDRRLEDLRNRTCLGFVALEQFRLWLSTREGKETNREKVD